MYYEMKYPNPIGIRNISHMKFISDNYKFHSFKK